MSLHDKTLFLFNNAALAKAATTSITSKLIDLRYNGGLDDNVYVKASLGASATDGYVTFTLQTSYDGSSWVTLISKTNVGATLFEGRLPKGCRRYLKSTVTVGTALAAATTVFGELTDTLDEELDGTKLQDWDGIPDGGTVPAGAENLATTGDSVRSVVES